LATWKISKRSTLYGSTIICWEQKTGLDFIAKLKAPDSRWIAVPIFVVSNTASEGNLRSYIRLGVSKYFVKAEHRLEEITSDIKTFLDEAPE